MKVVTVLSRYRSTLIILLLAIIGYWQLAFMQDLLKWDNMDAYHPYRFFIAECIRNQEFPFWNPYQFLGYPIYSDPASGAWYPVLWLIAIIMPYDFMAMNLEFIFHIFVAGFGMHRLCKYFGLQSGISLTVATAYMFTGFMVESAQLIVFTIGLAWIPMVLVAFLKMLRKLSWPSVFDLALFTTLLITGSYPAFTIILFYILLFVLADEVIRRFRQGELKRLKRLLWRLMVAAGVVLAASSGYLYAVIKALPHFTRGASLQYNEEVFGYSMNIPSLISLLTPVNNTYDHEITGNGFVYAFMGLLVLLLLLIFLVAFIRKDRQQTFLFIGGLVFLSAAFGNDLPVRYWLYQLLPGMDMFRHPVIFMAFAQLCFLVNAAFALQMLIRDYEKYRKYLRIVSILLLAVLLSTAIVISNNMAKEGPSFMELVVPDSYLGLEHSQLAQTITHLCLIVLLVTMLVVVSLFGKSSRLFAGVMMIGIILESFLTLQLNIDRKVTAHFPMSSAQHGLERLPAGFPLPDPDLKMKQVNDSMLNFPIPEIWKNLNIYAKRTAHDGYAPFILNNFDQLRNSALMKRALDHHLIYISDSNGSELSGEPIKYTSFSPSEVVVHTATDHDQLITLVQNDYPGWTVWIDEQAVDHFVTNLSNISARLPAGDHVVRFAFSDRPAEMLFILSAALCLLLLSIVCGFHHWGQPDLGRWSVLFSVVTMAVILLVIANQLVTANKPFHLVQQKDLLTVSKALEEYRLSQDEYATVVMNTDDPSFKEQHGKDHLHLLRFKESTLINIPSVADLVRESEGSHFIFGSYNVFNPPEVIALIREKYPLTEREWRFEKGGLWVFKKAAVEERKVYHEWTNDFEEPGVWGLQWQHTDTVVYRGGRRSFHMDSIVQYSPVFNLVYGEEHQSQDLFNIALDILTDENRCEAGLVFIVNKTDGREIWKHMDLLPYLSDNGKWQRLMWTIDLEEKVLENDTIKTYVWNRGKKEFFIDNMKVSLSQSIDR